MRGYQAVFLVVGLCVVQARCAGLSEVVPTHMSTFAAPVWNTARMHQTIEVLQQHGSDSEVHDSDEIRAFMTLSLAGLQILAQPQAIPVQHDARMRTESGATFVAGLDVWPHAQSGTGEETVDVLLPFAADSEVRSPSIGTVSAVLPTPEQLRKVNASMVIVLGRLDMRPVRHSKAGKVVMQMTYAAWANLSGMDREATLRWLNEGSPLALSAPVTAEVVARQGDSAKRYGMLGLLPGKDPAWSNELVIVGTNLGMGSQTAWVAPAGVIELAREAVAWSSAGLFPRRSILFALWPDSTGLSTYLKQPQWPADATRDILEFGLAEHESGNGSSAKVKFISLPPQGSQEATDQYLERSLDVLHIALMATANGS